MRYILMDEVNGDLIDREFDDKEEAIKEADYEWAHLSERDKKRRSAFYVLESVNPDEEAIDHHDGNPIWSAK